jgi:ParB/RepB/Spo0J family partition protein
MTDHLISLRLINDNPYQPRTIDDPEHIEKLARSIAADDLLQKPAARNHGPNGSCELAFGHSRRKAFEWLRDNWQAQGLADRYTGYTVMPVEIRELTDEEMYRFAVSENVQRKDLSPIDLAKAMKRYRDEFKKTSDQVGQLFGVNGATVRGLVRLLDLPASVQEKVETGEISQGAARKLLTVPLEDNVVKTLANEIAQGEDPDDVIENTLRHQENVVTMWESWRHDEKALGGSSLWPLDMGPDKFPMKYMPEMKPADIARSCNLEPTKDVIESIEFYIDQLTTKTDGSPAAISNLMDTFPQHAQMIERIAHFLAMPACVGCSFHAVVDRSHYCTLKPCHQRKTKAWIINDVQKVSKRMGFPIYDPAVDGKDFLPLCEYSYMDEYKKHEALVKAKDASLRIAPHKSDYQEQKFTNSHFARVIITGEKAKVEKQKKQDTKSREETSHKDRERQWKLENERRDASYKFKKEYALPFFATAFSPMTNLPALAALAGEDLPKKDPKKKETLARLHRSLAHKAINELSDYRDTEKGPTSYAKHLQGIATTWGVKLPADFIEVAKGYEPGVSTETKKAKAKK